MKARGIHHIARRFILRIGLGLIILIAAAALAYRPLMTISSAKTSYRSASTALAGLAQVRTLLSSLSSAESAFIATGKPEYRDAYAAAKAQVRREMDVLQGIFLNEPAQQERVARLNSLVRKRSALAERLMARPRKAAGAQKSDEENVVREIGTLLSDLEHPCQALADLQTLAEARPLAGATLAQGISGIIIYLKIRERQKKAGS